MGIYNVYCIMRSTNHTETSGITLAISYSIEATGNGTFWLTVHVDVRGSCVNSCTVLFKQLKEVQAVGRYSPVVHTYD